MWGLITWSAVRRNGTLATHQAWNAPEDSRWIAIGGFTIPVIVLATIFVVMLRTMAAFPMGDHEMDRGPAAVRVVGHQWWWEVHYAGERVYDEVVTANEIHLPIGRPMDIELGSYDVIHSFWIPKLHGKVDLIPGTVTTIRIQADREGTYWGQCAEYCGPQHAHMAIAVVAEPPAKFQKWMTQLRGPALAPSSGRIAAGQSVFLGHQCALCHTIRGTAARGTVGPELTHFGSRLGLAANEFPNTVGPLSAWVTHAQSLKPHGQMPSITAFTGDELQTLVEYLKSLE
jgi:cytochrome c oxidase subunit 2